ncbi:MAG: DUF975 family protein [Eubacteriales bacterium]
MLNTRKKIKRLAKTVMSGSFFKLLLILVLQAVTSALLVRVFGAAAGRLWPELVFRAAGIEINWAGTIAGIVGSALAAPIELGAAEFILRLVRRKECGVGDVFAWYSDGKLLGRAAKFGVWKIAASIVQAAAFDIPFNYLAEKLLPAASGAAETAEAAAGFEAQDFSAADWRGILAAAALIVLWGAFTVLGTAVKYVFADTGKLGKSLVTSFCVMRRHFFRYVLFLLSFAGFYIGIFFTAGLLGIYFIPYFNTAQAVYVEYVRAKARFDRGEEVDF